MAQYTPSAVKPPTGALADDGDLQSALPRICVDYLSHQWAEEDVWRSWRNMTRHKFEISNGLRLENASWRTWWKQRNKLKTVSPETLNWSVLFPSPFCRLFPFFRIWVSNPPFVSWMSPRELAAAWMAHGMCLSSLRLLVSPRPAHRGHQPTVRRESHVNSRLTRQPNARSSEQLDNDNIMHDGEFPGRRLLHRLIVLSASSRVQAYFLHEYSSCSVANKIHSLPLSGVSRLPRLFAAPY